MIIKQDHGAARDLSVGLVSAGRRQPGMSTVAPIRMELVSAYLPRMGVPVFVGSSHQSHGGFVEGDVSGTTGPSTLESVGKLTRCEEETKCSCWGARAQSYAS